MWKVREPMQNESRNIVLKTARYGGDTGQIGVREVSAVTGKIPPNEV